jgi:hypothetical protein
MKRCLNISSIVILAMLVLLSTSQLFAATPQLSASQTTMQGDGPGRDVVLSDLPDITAAQFLAMKQIPSPRNPHFGAALPKGNVVSLQEAASNALIPRSAGQTPGAFADFAGATQGCNGLGWQPSDMGLAVNNTYVVQTVNECLEVFSKAGALLAGPKDLCTLFGLPPNSGRAGCFDPRALYDTQAAKFLIIASYQDSAGNGFILTATAANPTLTWHTHIIFQGATLPDYPTLGQTAYLNNPDNSVYTVCFNSFLNSGGFTDQCDFFPKKAIIGTLGTYQIWLNFTLGGVLQNSMQPVNSYELAANPAAQYLINSVNDNGGICHGSGGGENGLVVWAESNALRHGGNGSHLSGFYTGCGSTATYSFPGAADNDGFCFGCIETIDNRITAMSFYNADHILVSIDTFNGYSSATLGWEVRPFLDVNGQGCASGVNCPNITGVSIEKQFCYDCGAGQGAQAYFGAIAPTAGGDWTQFATFSNNSITPGTFYFTNQASYATPPHDGGIFACQRQNAWSGRWGDYQAAAPDEPGTGRIAAVWGSGMYVAGSNIWGTCIAGTRPETP